MSVHLNAAVASLEAGAEAAALAHVERALAEAPEAYGPRAIHARILNAFGRHDEATAAARGAMAADPMRAGGHLQLGWALMELGRLHEAEAAFEAVRAIEPASPGLLELSARAALRSRDDARFGLRTEELLTHLPDAAVSHVLRSTWLIRAKRPEEAERHARRALAIDAENGEAHFILGMALGQLHRAAEAVVALESAVRLMPTSNACVLRLRQARSAARLEGRIGHVADALLRFGLGPVFAVLLCGHAALSAGLILQRLGHIGLDEGVFVWLLIAMWACGIGLIEVHLRRAGPDAARVTLSDEW